MKEKTIYSVGDFEGPLDLLLTLVQKNKIDICDIVISDITAQYLSVVRSWQAMDMDVASDFVVMASRLLEIKSYRLLPKPKQQQTEDPEATLVRQLKDYQMFKAVSGCLEKRIAQNSGAVYRDPMPVDVPDHQATIEIDVSALKTSYDKAVRRYQADNAFRDKPDTHTKTPPYTTNGQREKIRALLAQSKHRPIFFSNIIFDHKSSEVVASFLAMLDLAKENRVALQQRVAFGDIEVSEIHGTADRHEAAAI